MPDGPLAAYRALCAAGQLRGDDAQGAAVGRLDALYHELADDRPAKTGGLLARLGLGQANPAPPRGLYLHGPVGRGKSMLMDLFYDAAPVDAKRRVHFHAFMLEVHRRLNELRTATGSQGEPLTSLAHELAAEARLLCFDEFHVQNIADAMILGRLFEGLLEAGVVMVATSNFTPDRLYEGGLNRERFVPFIELLKDRMDVIALDGITDYRLERLRDVPVYHAPLGPETAARLEALFDALSDGAPGAAEEVAVGRRRLVARS